MWIKRNNVIVNTDNVCAIQQQGDKVVFRFSGTASASTIDRASLSAELQHEIRYTVQQFFIPEMVECVKDDNLPFISLFPSAQWYTNLRKEYAVEDLKAAKVWESFEKIDVDEDHMIILYTFPEPEEVPEALYGAILFEQSTGDIQYFTLEASYEGRWAKCSRSVSMHSLKGFMDAPDKDKFVQWVMGRL